MIIKKNMRIVFAGDSITDAGASTNEPDNLGMGYPRYIRDYLYSKYPELNVEIIDRGINGERSSDLLKRYESSILSEKPHFVSICIGTNDMWRQFDSPQMNVNTPEIYEENVRQMLEMTKKYNKDIPILLFEVPVVERGFKKHSYSYDMETKGNEIIDEYNASVHKLSYEYNTFLCPINKIIRDNIVTCAKVKYTKDGVHPSSTGAMTFALSWCSCLGI